MEKISPVVLIILDGWGYARSWGGNAITIANVSNYNKLIREFPNTVIAASGQSVGLPGNEVGNSEVGHMNLGAGRIVPQDIQRINRSISDGSFYKNQVLIDTIERAKKTDRSVHLIGIVSDGGIHSHIVHLFALMKLCKIQNCNNVLIHVITDGRDTDPMRGIEFVTTLNKAISELKIGKIATVSGRVYLDRKGDWPRTEAIYNAICGISGMHDKSALTAIGNAYRRGENDEYIRPTIIDGAIGGIHDGDSIIFYNFRSDRTRQLTRALLDPNFSEFKREKRANLDFISFIPYGVEREIKIQVKTAFPATQIADTLAKLISQRNQKQFHIAETEKYAHVTYFFNGNIENPYPGEDRMIIPSPQVKNYAERPEMSAEQIKDNLIKNIKRNYYNFVVCNFANPDMVGHSGSFEAAVKAVEFVDLMLKEILRVAIDREIHLIITADHGNIEQMVDPATGHPDPEHTKNPVPLIIVSENKSIKLRDGGILGNVAETCLELMGANSNGLFLDSLIQK